MRTAEQWLSEYGESHRNHTNKTIHWICVPLIVFSLVGMLWSIPSAFLSRAFPPEIAPFVNFGTLTLLIALLFYVRMSLPLALGMLLFAALCVLGNYWLSRYSPLPLFQTSLLIFAVAWVGQFIGHKIEGKKPSFLKDVQFLMIGPAWLMSFIYQRLGIRY